MEPRYHEFSRVHNIHNRIDKPMNSANLYSALDCISLQCGARRSPFEGGSSIHFFMRTPLTSVHWRILLRAKPVYGPPSPGEGKVIPKLLCEKPNKPAQERQAMFTIQSWLLVYSPSSAMASFSSCSCSAARQRNHGAS
jgi:hypothetical protein